MMSRSRFAVVVLVLAAVAAVGLRMGVVEAKQTLSHDEAISYLAATCHQSEYERIVRREAYPLARWAPAADWKRLIEPDEALCFTRIAEGLALHDIHPPLYFWLLHLWTLAAGTGVANGTVLNLALVLLTGLALFGLARDVLGDRLEAAFAASLWGVSPAVVAVSSDARQYDLLALVTVLFVWQALRFADAPPERARRAAVLLGVVAAAGALTHYHFALVAVAATGVLALRLRRTSTPGSRGAARRRFGLGLGAIAAGYATFWLAHPRFLESFARQEGQASDFDPADLGRRADRTVSALAEFFVGKLESPAVAYGVVVLVAALAGVAALRAGRTRARGERRRPGGAERSMLLVLVWLAGTTIVLYLAFVSPINAMGGRYLATSWPFLALAVVIALRSAGTLRPWPAVALVAGSVAFSTVEVLQLQAGAERLRDPSPLETERGALVVDTVRRGLLPAILLAAPERKPVFVADQDVLLDREPAWLPRLDGEAAYASTLSSGGTRLRRRALLKTIRTELGGVRAAGDLRLWDSARPRGPRVVRVYRFGDAEARRLLNGRPAPARQSRRR